MCKLTDQNIDLVKKTWTCERYHSYGSGAVNILPYFFCFLFLVNSFFFWISDRYKRIRFVVVFRSTFLPSFNYLFVFVFFVIWHSKRPPRNIQRGTTYTTFILHRWGCRSSTSHKFSFNFVMLSYTYKQTCIHTKCSCPILPLCAQPKCLPACWPACLTVAAQFSVIRLRDYKCSSFAPHGVAPLGNFHDMFLRNTGCSRVLPWASHCLVSPRRVFMSRMCFGFCLTCLFKLSIVAIIVALLPVVVSPVICLAQ